MHRFSIVFSLWTIFLLTALSDFGIRLDGLAWAAPPSQSPTITPVSRDGWHLQRHQKMNERVKQGNVDLLMIGDSITQAWEAAGKEVWQRYYGRRNAVNLGISGDRTQHVLWRLSNGNLDGISPKLAVVMIGTNNAGDNTSEEIAEGIQAIVTMLRTRLPKMKVLVLGIFPRGEADDDARRQVTMKTNEIIARWVEQTNNAQLVYLDIGDAFLDNDRSLSRQVMPDLLHLSPAAYSTWAEAMEPTVARLLGDPPVASQE